MKMAHKQEMPLTEKVARVKSIADELESDMRNAAAVWAMLDVANEDADLRALFDHTYEANGYNIVYNTLLDQCIACVIRSQDLPDTRGNRASLPQIMCFLKDTRVIDYFIEKARDWIPGGAFADKNASDALHHLTRARAYFACFQAKREAKEWRSTLRKFRDRNLAHSLVDMPDTPPPLFEFVNNLRRATAPMIFDLAIGVHGKNLVNWEDSETEWNRIARMFWKRLRIGMEAGDLFNPKRVGSALDQY